jgi:3-phenylpropionate/trans-cinnamate dioxygenase ferredoxin subunit
MRYDLMDSSELGRGEMKPVDVGGTAIVVMRAPDGALFALRDRCPHHGAALSGGRFEEMVVAAAPGQFAMSGDFLVRCPWHQFEFMAETGICPIDDRQRVRRFTVEDVDGRIVLER